MTAEHNILTSRRTFLNVMIAGVAATASGSALAQNGQPAQRSSKNEVDQVRRCNLNGILPAPHARGSIQVETADCWYLVFDAQQYDEFGKPIQSGSAVLQLQGCLARKTRMPGNYHLAEHSVDFSKLQNFSTYEVLNSGWVDMLANGNRDAALKLHHYIITYDAVVSFEFVVAKVEAHISTLPFWDLHNWLLEVSGKPVSMRPVFLPPPADKAPAEKQQSATTTTQAKSPASTLTAPKKPAPPKPAPKKSVPVPPAPKKPVGK